MITEFTCGIYTATYASPGWNVKVNNIAIGSIGEDGKYLKTSNTPHLLTISDLLELGVLMETIKRQYTSFN